MFFEFNCANVCANPICIEIGPFRRVELAVKDGKWIVGGLFASDDLLFIEGLPCSILNGSFLSKTDAIAFAYRLVKDLEIRNKTPYSLMKEALCVKSDEAWEERQLSLF